MMRSLRSLFQPVYEIRISHPIDSSAGSQYGLQKFTGDPCKDTNIFEDLGQGFLARLISVLHEAGLSSHRALVRYQRNMITVSVRAHIANDAAAWIVADRIRGCYRDEIAVSVVALTDLPDYADRVTL